MTTAEIAATNFERHIKKNPYPGRGIVVGRASEGGGWLLVYWIMGRSAHSRNRQFIAEGTTLRTEALDPSQVEDPSLIIYEAMLDRPGAFIVTNGDQTRTIFDALEAGGSFDDALATREREPDEPNYTPRISALLEPAAEQLTLSILKANPADASLTDRTTFRPAPPPPGFGYCLTTYAGDGNPLPPFPADPLLVPCDGATDAVLATYWDALDASNRIAVAVKHVSAAGTSCELLIRNGG